MDGMWRITYSLYSRVYGGEENSAFIYMNGNKEWGTEHKTTSESSVIRSTGSRVLTRVVKKYTRFDIRAAKMNNHYFQIMFCAEYLGYVNPKTNTINKNQSINDTVTVNNDYF